MSNHEEELLNLIKEHDNPEQALEVAINLMIDFLKKHEAPQCKPSEHLRETV